jgi:hypothetical protein
MQDDGLKRLLAKPARGQARVAETGPSRCQGRKAAEETATDHPIVRVVRFEEERLTGADGTELAIAGRVMSWV